MQNYYADAVVDTAADVTRGIHNGTQFVRLVLQRPQPESCISFTASGSLNLDTPERIDGSFVASPTTGVRRITVGFGTLVRTNTIVVYSTTAIDTNTSNWFVETSLNNLESEFNNSSFDANVTNVTSAIVPTVDGGNQFKYTLTVTDPAIDTTDAGLPYWRIRHATADIFDNVTEVQILEPLTPTISYFDTDGDFASSFTFAEDKILDAAYDNINGIFFTIRFNDDNVGTSTITLDDDFEEGSAGTASGTTNFNSGRWTESSTNTAFLRTGGKLSYNVGSGKGQIETTFTMNNFTAALHVTPTAVTTEPMWMALRALDSDNKTLIQEGVGWEQSPVTSGVFFASSLESFSNSTASCTFRDARPLWHNAASGTDSFTIQFNGSVWTVTGTLTGALPSAQTGVLYDEVTAPTTPIEFLISSTATPTNGENFTFNLVTDNVKKLPTATGVLLISRTGTSATTGNVFTTPRTISSAAASFEIFGNTNGSINIQADDFDVTGSGTFPSVSVFTIERTDDEGDLTATPTVIESFDVIGDPSKTYNDFLNGRVQIACTQSGTGGGFIYIKIDNKLYKYPNNISLTSETGSSATVTTIGQIATDGTHSFAWSRESGIGGLPFLTYHEYDSTLDIVHLRTIDHNTLVDTTDQKEVLLNQTTYTTTNKLKVFYDQNDFDTLYFVDTSNNLRAFNLDDRISAFMSVNAEDVTLPAGTSQQTFVNADVINAWGESLDGKVVTFSVTAGDGAVSPSSDTTVSGGRATTQFTVGSTVGVSTVTATVTET
jgi:hypothetical protein